MNSGFFLRLLIRFAIVSRDILLPTPLHPPPPPPLLLPPHPLPLLPHSPLLHILPLLIDDRKNANHRADSLRKEIYGGGGGHRSFTKTLHHLAICHKMPRLPSSELPQSAPKQHIATLIPPKFYCSFPLAKPTHPVLFAHRKRKQGSSLHPPTATTPKLTPHLECSQSNISTKQ